MLKVFVPLVGGFLIGIIGQNFVEMPGTIFMYFFVGFLAGAISAFFVATR